MVIRQHDSYSLRGISHRLGCSSDLVLNLTLTGIGTSGFIAHVDHGLIPVLDTTANDEQLLEQISDAETKIYRSEFEIRPDENLVRLVESALAPLRGLNLGRALKQRALVALYGPPASRSRKRGELRRQREDS